MKWIKRLLILLIILLIWVSAIVAYCAYDPDMTQRIADALYGKNASTVRTDYSDPELDKYMAELRENVTLPAEALDMKRYYICAGICKIFYVFYRITYH